MSRFKVTGTVSMSADRKLIVQYHKENVTYFKLIKMLVKFFLKKEFGFYIKYEIPLRRRIKKGRVDKSIYKWIEIINKRKDQVRIFSETEIRMGDIIFYFYPYLNSASILWLEEFKYCNVNTVDMYLLFKHFKKIVKEK
ncbi:hypothetical protein ACLSY0_00390 [Avibacterium avium]|uniref:hypothetical protein n=1 Tax=Avibacterium avium TaxID=751 RepID=UPI003BF8427E